LWETCRLNQRHYPETVKQLKFLYRDGNAGLKDFAPYNGIHVAYDLESDAGTEVVTTLKEQLKVRNGILVYPSGNLIKVIQRVDIDDYVEEIVPGFIFKPGKQGLV
jgi:protein-L-isoaspartate O-methyltransferase